MKFAAVILAAFLAGCVHVAPKSAAARVTFDASGSLAFEQVDFAADPARVSTSEEVFTLTIPAGSVVSFCDAAGVASDRADTLPAVTGPASPHLASSRDFPRPPASWNVTLSRDTPAAFSRRAVTISGPKSFPPPVGPSPSQIAAGNAAWLWRIGLFAGLALAGLGVWWKGGLVIAGGLSVAGASAFGWFVEENPWLLWVFGGGVALAASGFALWHLWLKHRRAGTSPAGSALAAASR